MLSTVELTVLKIVIALSTVILGSIGAQASNDLAGDRPGFPTQDHATPTLAPLAYVSFCQRNPADCRAATRPLPSATPERRAQLDLVNREVNRSIVSRDTDDIETEWQIAPNAGNCNDYAVTKRHRLLALGWPSSSLLLARVRTLAPMVDHLILVVRTQEDSYVLDNLSDVVRPKQERAYHWLKRQSADNPNVWVWGS